MGIRSEHDISIQENLVSVLIITMNRLDDIRACLESLARQTYHPMEIIVVDGGSTDGTAQFLEHLETIGTIRLIQSGRAIGVAASRNLAIAQARGEILVTIDDDAEFGDEDDIQRAVAYLNRHEQVGILAFKVVNFWTGELQRSAFPSLQKRRDSTTAFETSWFIGAGHAIRREVHDVIGAYGDFNPFGHEEWDFSLRALDAGWMIHFFPHAKVRHKIPQEHMKGRSRVASRLSGILYNRMKVASLRLPLAPRITTWLYWNLRTAYNARSPKPCWRANKRLWQDRFALRTERSVVRRRTRRYIRSLGAQGRYWF